MKPGSGVITRLLSLVLSVALLSSALVPVPASAGVVAMATQRAQNAYASKQCAPCNTSSSAPHTSGDFSFLSTLKELNPFALKVAYASSLEGVADKTAQDTPTQKNTLPKPKPWVSRLTDFFSSLFVSPSAAAAVLETTPTLEPSLPVGALRELTESRSAYSRKYLMSDGNIKAQYADTPMNFLDSQGEFEPIDSTLKRVEATKQDGAKSHFWTNKANGLRLACLTHYLLVR